MSQKANLQRFNILWVPQPKDKHGTYGKMFLWVEGSLHYVIYKGYDTGRQRKLNIKINVQLTVLQIKRSILARGAKGLVRKNSDNLKIVQKSDLAWISSQIRLWQLIRSAVLQKWS